LSNRDGGFVFVGDIPSEKLAIDFIRRVGEDGNSMRDPGAYEIGSLESTSRSGIQGDDDDVCWNELILGDERVTESRENWLATGEAKDAKQDRCQACHNEPAAD
jgi:hypothetical protein